ncbi:MAG: nucleotidyltransferase domain-containing protein [Chloroflexi bacterium]|nr:nucleotidyltransferase domain-containing protein [Chloroflexota bacterium]
MRKSALVKTNVAPRGFPPVSETLPKAVRRLVRKLKPEKIILFGSYAYGTPTPDSDADLLIVTKTNGKEKEMYRAASLLLVPRQFPVDIIVKTSKEIDAAMKGGAVNGFFTREMVKKGKVLYGRRKRT